MTPTEIKHGALKLLGVVDVNQTPSAEQGAAVGEKYAGLHAMLLQNGLARWALTENIPAKAEQPVTWMLAYLCAVDERFGSIPAKQAELATLGALHLPSPSLGERQLRAMYARKPVSQPAQSDYY